MRTIVAVCALFVGGSAAAQTQWTPAPTPRVGASDTVQPAARGGVSASTHNSAPFSGIPEGSPAADGTSSSNLTDQAKTPSISPE